MPKLQETILIPKSEFLFYKNFRNSFSTPPFAILDEWYDNVEKANQVFFDLTPNNITVSDDGLGMEYDTFINDFLRMKDTQGVSPNSTGIFGVGGSKGVPYLIGRPLSIAFCTRDGKSYYKGEWEYDGPVSEGLFPLSEINSASVNVYSITKSEYLKTYTREDGFVPSFVFVCERLGKYAGDYNGKKTIELSAIKRNLSVKMMEGKSLPDVTVTDTNIKGKKTSEDLIPAYHPFVKVIDWKTIVAPNSLETLPFEKKKFIIGDNAVLRLKCYKKSNITTEGDRVNETLIQNHRTNEVALIGATNAGREAAPNKPIVMICNKNGRILHRYIIDDTIRSSNSHLMNFMVFVFYMETWNEAVPFNLIKPAPMTGDVYTDFNQKILDWMQKPAQQDRFTHGETKDEDRETETIRDSIVYGTENADNNARAMIADIVDCRPRQLTDPNIVRCQASKGEVRDLDLKIETEIPCIIENKIGRIGQQELDQAGFMSYMLGYKHHMILLCDEMSAHFRDNPCQVTKKRMQDDVLGKAVSFTVMTKTSLKTGTRGDTDFIELYRHEDYIV
jgi:hypothetical protein